MDTEIRANLYPCAHCKQTGTCMSGSDGKSCLACVKLNALEGKELVGVPCGCCNGLGMAEPRTERINKRIKPLLAFGIIVGLLSGVFISAILKSPYFSEILAFSGTLIGSVVGYYFSVQHNKNA